MADQLSFLLVNLPNLLFGFPGHRPGGLMMSIYLAVVAIGLGLAVAVVIGSGSESRLRPIRMIGRLYVGIFRGLPLILLLLLVHTLLASSRRYGMDLSPRTSVLVALTLYSSAYQAEIVRAGLRAVPVQLVESARLMGASPWQVYLLVKLPYTWRVMLPAFAGEAISLFKDTSVVIIIGVAELMTVARIVLGGDPANAPYWVSLYLVVGMFYFVVAFSLSQFAQRWEKRIQTPDLVHSLANY